MNRDELVEALLADLRRVAAISGSDMAYDPETGVVDYEGCFRPIEIVNAVVPLIVAECARIAEEHKGASKRERQARKRRYDQDDMVEILAEERGEDIASGIIAQEIRNQLGEPNDR